VSTRRGRLLIDCGADWRGRIRRFHPTAILITHGHPDHAGGLAGGAPCPVYATKATLRLLARWPLKSWGELPMRTPVLIGGFVVECCPVQHSLNAPAVGFRISADDACFFYVPDVAALIDVRRTLRGVDLYVGDGATLKRSLVRRRGTAVIGHTSIQVQLAWCRIAGVSRAVFTHCGSGIVRLPPGRAEGVVDALGRGSGVHARLAYDGMSARIGSFAE
jgi:phosphoribosyl 1,2-cyclic phosphodiesterase